MNEGLFKVHEISQGGPLLLSGLESRKGTHLLILYDMINKRARRAIRPGGHNLYIPLSPCLSVCPENFAFLCSPLCVSPDTGTEGHWDTRTVGQWDKGTPGRSIIDCIEVRL